MESTLKKQGSNLLAETGIPNQSLRSQYSYPIETRIPGRYGQQSIPVNINYMRNNHIPQQDIHMNRINNNSRIVRGQSHIIRQPGVITGESHRVIQPIYSNMRPSVEMSSIPVVNNTIYRVPSTVHQHHRHYQQPHLCQEHSKVTNQPPVQYIQKSVIPNPVTIPVYYQQPILVREQWQRPLDSHVKQQQWRFVKTQDREGVVKYVTRQQPEVEVHQSKWDSYYMPKKSVIKEVVAPKQKKTCCTPLLFGIIGLLALLGVIVGLILLLTSRQAAAVTGMKLKYDDTDPNIVQIKQQFPAVPIPPITNINVITTPSTTTQALSVSPITTVVSTAKPEKVQSETTIQKIQAVNPIYQTQVVNNVNNLIDYNNGYQIKGDKTGYVGRVIIGDSNIDKTPSEIVSTTTTTTTSTVPLATNTITTTETISPLTTNTITKTESIQPITFVSSTNTGETSTLQSTQKLLSKNSDMMGTTYPTLN